MPWRGPAEEGEFPTAGWICVDWIESTLRFNDGPKTGQFVQLYDEQAMHLLNRYRINPLAVEGDGNDAYRWRGSQLIRGQKWGKDPLMAMVDLFHAFGPCDFAGWDADGEPVTRPHPSPWIFVAALNDLQAQNTWLPLKWMVENTELGDLPGVEVNLDQIRLPCGNPIERLTTTAFGRLGGRFTGGSLTENGLMTATGDNQNTGKRSPLSFARTLIRSVAGMQGMWIGASNIWDPTELSHAQQIAQAKRPSVYVDAKKSRRRVEFDDTEGLKEELLYLYGDSARENGGHVSTGSLINDIRDESNGETEVRRFFLSEELAGESPLAHPEQWAAALRTDDPLQPGERITLGFDGSRSRDATVLTACRISDGRIFHLRTWIPAQGPGGTIPRTEVDRAVRDTFSTYEVWYLYADPYKWQDYLDLWAATYKNRVLEVPTNVEVRMDDILERFTTALRAREFSHDGNETLTQHVRDAVIVKGRRKPSKPRHDDDGNLIEHYLKIAKKREGLLIDAAVSMLLALEARGKAIEEGATKKSPPSPVSLAGTTAVHDLQGPWNDLPDLNTIQF